MFNIPTQRLAKVTVTETTSAVTLSVNPIVIAALSFTPRHLVVRVNATNDTSVDDLLLRFNGDTGSNYNRQYLFGNSSTKAAGRDTNSTFINTGAYPGGTDNVFGGGEILIPDALSTRSHKSTISLTGAAESYVMSITGRWASTAAITSVTLIANNQTFAAGSTFELCVVDESFNIDQDGDGELILGSAGTFSVGSIGAADGDLVCIGNVRSDRTYNWDAVKLSLNSDTTAANYNTQWLYGVDSTTNAWAGTTLQVADGLPDENNAAGAFGAFVSQITNFSDGSNDRVVTTLSGAHAPAVPHGEVNLITTRWNNTSAVTAIDYSPNTGTNFVVGSMLSTYAVPKNLITRTELGSDTSSVTFSSIPATYDHLEVTVYARTDRSAVNDVVNMTFNTDTTASNYDHQELQGAGTTVSANTDAANFRIGVYASASEGANEFGTGTTTIYNYTKTDRHKHRLTVMGSSERVLLYSRRWEDTSAINQIVLTPNVGDNFLAGSVFTLRGISSTIPVALPAAGYTIFF